jgi:CRISPR-associated protein Csb3
MSEPIRVAVDPTNPGQFFACCSLLELAGRLWPGAEGWFRDGEFRIACGGTLGELISRLSQAQIRSSLSAAQLKRLGTLLSKAKATLTAADLAEKTRLQEMWKLERLHLSAPFDLWLDWWRDERGERTELKTWAAKQLVAEMAQAMLAIIDAAPWSGTPDPANPFPQVQADTLAFNFDSDLSGQGSARDAGFSFDTLGFKSPFRPLLELLAFIGLQRFRPGVGGDRRMRYCLWSTPLPPSVAAAAACGVFGVDKGRLYAFRLFNRTKYMKAFLPAQPDGGL